MWTLLVASMKHHSPQDPKPVSNTEGDFVLAEGHNGKHTQQLN